MSIYYHRGIQVRGGRAREIEDKIIREGRFKLFINGALYTEMVASDEQLKELGAGFAICQGLARRVESVEIDGTSIYVTTSLIGGSDRQLSSSGALGTLAPSGKVSASCSITTEDIFSITREIETDVWK